MSGYVLWLTGLSGAGKTTICSGLQQRALRQFTYRAVALDGDALRRGICSDLGFTPADRRENVRRVAHLGALLADGGLAVTVGLISPYRADREQARAIIGAERFRLIYVKAPLAVCEQRDPKGLYRRARRGEVADFTGIDAPYEEPHDADLVVDTVELNERQSVDLVWAYVERAGFGLMMGSGGGI
jgi:adenylyl-sulfate kinase